MTITIDERQRKILLEALRHFSLEAIKSYDLDTYMEYFMLLDCIENPSKFPQQSHVGGAIKLAA